jgi:hypothetical protein
VAVVETPLLSAQVTDVGEALVVTLTGELTTSTAPAVGSLLLAIEDDAPGGRLVIDLRDAEVVEPAEEVLFRGWRHEQIRPRVWRLMTRSLRRR